jgi:hypothetical protein
MIRDYKITLAPTVAELEQSVLDSIDQEWEPLGAPFLVLAKDSQSRSGNPYGQSPHYLGEPTMACSQIAQAMVRYYEEA